MKRFLELDAMRGLAAMLVVVFHYTMNSAYSGLPFNLGSSGVDLFFMISGFVIFLTLTRTKRKKDFVVNRFSRLFPTYWTVVLLTAGLMMIFGKPEVLNNHNFTEVVLSNLTMFQQYWEIPDLDGPYWTMVLELTFYLAIFAFFVLNALRRFTQFSLIAILALIVLVGFYPEFTGLKLLFKYIPFLQYLPLFYAGILFYKIYFEKASNAYFQVVICFVAQLIFFEHVGRSSGVMSMVEYACCLLCYFGLFLLFVRNKLGWLVSKPALFLGKISYALYLVHQFVSLHVLFPRLEPSIGFWLSRLVALTCCILLAYLITVLIERPAMKAIRGYWASKK